MRECTLKVRYIEAFNLNLYHVLIDTHILRFFNKVHSGTVSFIIQEDNCGPHLANYICTYLSNEGITRIKYSAQFPDLNPIENIY